MRALTHPLTAALLLSLIATACTPVTPPGPPNMQLLNVRPEVAGACGHVLWTLSFYSKGENVTPNAWYTGNAGPSPTVRTPQYDLFPSTAGISGYRVEATDAAGAPLAPEFADSILHLFTCMRTGHTAFLYNALVPGPGQTNAGFPTVTLRHDGTTLRAGHW